MAEAAAPPRPLRFGEALPLDHAPSNRNERFALGAMGGRFVLFCVIGDHGSDAAKTALTAVAQTRFDEGARVCAIANADPTATDDTYASFATHLVFTDAANTNALGLSDPQRAPEGRWVLFDPSLRVLAAWRLADSAAALTALAHAPAPSDHAGVGLHAPVLIAPRVFEPEFCKRLIDYYKQIGGQASGVTQENAEGRTFVGLQDTFKRRTDCVIEDAKLREAVMQRIYWRLTPEIEKAFMWRPTRMERYLVACYESASGGFFKPHRDNSTKGTAHRRFAVTINLNAGEYEGGDLRFPEFGAKTYRAPTGGAVVFSCALLHEATPVTAGQRYAFLPFLYDEAAAELRAENDKYLDESIRPYRGD